MPRSPIWRRHTGFFRPLAAANGAASEVILSERHFFTAKRILAEQTEIAGDRSHPTPR
jgi:hypothetical protein